MNALGTSSLWYGEKKCMSQLCREVMSLKEILYNHTNIVLYKIQEAYKDSAGKPSDPGAFHFLKDLTTPSTSTIEGIAVSNWFSASVITA